MKSYLVACLKAYGDLVIANTILRQIDPSVSPAFGLVVCNHLRELTEAIEPSCPVMFLDHGEKGVPSVFDMRKNGTFRATASAIRLRKAIGDLTLEANTSFIFDRSGIRERFLTRGMPTVTLPQDVPNIYQAYSVGLSALGFSLKQAKVPPRLRLGPVGIFPGSRMAEKNFSLSLVRNVIESCEQSGASPQLFLLEGERPDLERSGLEYVGIPRRFSAMINAVESCGSLIAADSMPAHLAEASRVPVFVLSPIPNEFWLPLSCYVQARWCVFDHPTLGERLSGYLDSLN
jgi:hypothetical protein